MRRVVLESPYAGDVERNVAYARRCLRDSLMRGEAPIASHLLYTQVLDDGVPVLRRLGIEAGQSWIPVAHGVAVYEDYGISSGMQGSVGLAITLGLEIEFRKIGANP